MKKEQFVQAGATAEGSLGYVKSESKLEIEDSGKSSNANWK